MERLIGGTMCPHIKGREVGCSCEFCPYMFGITEDNDVFCGYWDLIEELEKED